MPRFHSYFSLINIPLPDALSRSSHISGLAADDPNSLKGEKRYSFRSQRYLVTRYFTTDTLSLSSAASEVSIIFLGNYLRYSYAIDKAPHCSL